MKRYLPGDIVSRRKGFVMHRGVALGDGRVLHNTPFKGEHICSEAEFCAGHPLYVTRLDRAARQRALLHADTADRPYSLFNNNCEHTVARAIGAEVESPQLQRLGRGTRRGRGGFRVNAAPRRGGRGIRGGAQLDVA